MKKLFTLLLCTLLLLGAAVPALAADKVAFDSSVTTVFEGEQLQLTLITEGAPAGGEVTYKSSAPSKLYVDENGLATGLEKGVSTVTATVRTDRKSYKATIRITVARKVAEVALNPDKLVILPWEEAVAVGLVQPVVDENGLSVVPDVQVIVIRLGAKVRLTATALPEDASNRDVVFETMDDSILGVKGDTVTGVGLGECDLLVVSEQNPEVRKAYRVAVVTPVNRITLESDVKTLFVGETAAVTPSFTPDTAGYRAVNWKSSNERVLTVDEAGVVTGVGRGSASVTATAADGSGKSAKVNFSVKQQPEEIRLSESAINLSVGKKTTLKATVLPKNTDLKGVVWESSDENVATVNARGQITPVAPGECIITCRSDVLPGIAAECEVAVVQPVKKIVLSAPTADIYVGQTLVVAVECQPDNATVKAVSWKSSNERVLTVSDAGVVTGVGKGRATVTATAEDGSKVRGTINVDVLQQPESVSLNDDSFVINVGARKNLRATVLPNNASSKKVVWASSDPAVATVTEAGQVRPVAPGTCTITVACEDFPAITASAQVEVRQPVTSIKFMEDEITINVGDSVQVWWTVAPDNATDPSVTVSTNKEKVLAVEQNGVIRGLSRGECYVYAKANDDSGKRGRLLVNVLQPVYGVHMKEDTYAVGVDESITVTAELEPSNASNTRMTWYVADPSMASVSGSRTRPTVTGRRWGTTSITGITEDGGYSATATINVGNYDKAVKITDLYLQDNRIKIVVHNESNMNISRVYYQIACYDWMGQPLACNVDGSNTFDGYYGYTLYENDITTHGRFSFSDDFVQPALPIAHVTMTITGYRTDQGFFHNIDERRRTTAEFKTSAYVGATPTPSPSPAPDPTPIPQ